MSKPDTTQPYVIVYGAEFHLEPSFMAKLGREECFDKTEAEQLSCTEMEPEVDWAQCVGKHCAHCGVEFGWPHRNRWGCTPLRYVDLDPLDHLVDGLTVRECLERYEAWQREDVSKTEWARTEPRKPAYVRRDYLTTAQVDAARAAWSAQLRAKVDQAEEKERVAVVVDDDRWEL